MSRYEFLVKILDAIRAEANSLPYASRYLGDGSVDGVNQARSRAFIHLFLKVSFGILGFQEREHCITDGAYDGGIDGYYLDHTAKTIILIQSKFRTNETNFSSKEIGVDEILRMDIDRIARGEESDESGNRYNGKVLQLEREISGIPDVGRWKYKVIILANLTGYSESQLLRLTEGTPVEVYSAEICFSKLVFPVLSGTFYNSTELRIQLDLSSKYAGTKISYNVTTSHTDCEITVVFVPLSEIAKVLHKYKNSILKYNPRSYLELEGKKVNQAIRKTVLETKTNEFALFNNGITMLSDETDINERIGQRNKAQLTVTNPQIINGGQTAYTLSRIYEELSTEEQTQHFSNKEVLLKIITVLNNEEQSATPEQKAELIDQISAATNQQTTVVNADKFSNDQAYLRIQQEIWNRYGLLFERKRGEFADGLHKGYLDADRMIERNLLFKLFFAVRGDVGIAVQKRLFMRFNDPTAVISDPETLDKVAFSFFLHSHLTSPQWHGQTHNIHERDRETFAAIYVLANRNLPKDVKAFEDAAGPLASSFAKEWRSFVSDASHTRKEFWRNTFSPKTGKNGIFFSAARWMVSASFKSDIEKRFSIVPYSKNGAAFLDVNPNQIIGDHLMDTEKREERRIQKQSLIPIDDAAEKMLASGDELQFRTSEKRLRRQNLIPVDEPAPAPSEEASSDISTVIAKG